MGAGTRLAERLDVKICQDEFTASLGNSFCFFFGSEEFCLSLKNSCTCFLSKSKTAKQTPQNLSRLLIKIVVPRKLAGVARRFDFT